MPPSLNKGVDTRQTPNYFRKKVGPIQRMVNQKCVCVCVCVCVCARARVRTHLLNSSLMSNSLQHHGASVHGIFQAGILEWVAISFSRGIFLTQGWNLHLQRFLYWKADSFPLILECGRRKKSLEQCFPNSE